MRLNSVSASVESYAPPEPSTSFVSESTRSWTRTLADALPLLVCLALLRLPSFLYGVTDIDETDFLVVGQRILDGSLPYIDTVEQKPILLYLTYALGGLFGFSILPMQILGLLWTFATCMVVRACAIEATEDVAVGRMAAWLCGLLSCANVFSINAELMLNLPASLGILFYLRSERRKQVGLVLAAGLAMGCASLYKHQAGILLVTGLVAIFTDWNDHRGFFSRIGRSFLIGFGFALPWLLATGIYALLGHLDGFFEWNIERNFVLSGSAAGSPWERLAESFLLFVVLGAPIPWWFAAKEVLSGNNIAHGRRFLVGGLLLTVIPVSLGGRFYSHYFLQFVPLLAIVAAPELASLLARLRSKPARRRWLRFGLLIFPIGFSIGAIVRGGMGKYPCQAPAAVALGGWLRQNTPADSRLFVWGHYTPIYYLSQRLPGTRYHNTSVHMGDFDPGHLGPNFDVTPHISERDVEATLLDLDRLRPAYIADTSPANIHSWGKIPLSKFPRLADYIGRNYHPVARPGGAVVYAHNDVGRQP